MATSDIKDFFAGKSIFITGATGFVGRLLVAKLLRMNNVKEILICSRPKKGKSSEERLEAMLSGFLFQSMEKYDKSYRSRLKIVNCDLEQPDLGISKDDSDYMKENVEIVIHAGATVNFAEKLRSAITINVRGTKILLDLALEMKKLESFVYVSTAYSQCPRSDIKETFYEPPMNYRQAFDVVEFFDDDLINHLTAKIIAPWPNTYTFTKAITEDMVREYSSKLPIAVHRPSIVVATFKDPIPGFSDTILTLMGISIGIMLGVVRVLKCNPNKNVDGVPADVAVNTILAVAKFQTEPNTLKVKQKVFNCVCKDPITLGIVFRAATKYSSVYPTKRVVWLPSLTIVTSNLLHKCLFLLYHCVPAIFTDIALWYSGSKLRLMKIQKKIYHYQNLYSFFIKKTWTFEFDNMKQIQSLMTPADAEDFFCFISISAEVIESYGRNGVDGLRRYFFNENDEDLIEARRKIMKLKFIYYGMLLLAVSFIIKIMLSYNCFGTYGIGVDLFDKN